MEVLIENWETSFPKEKIAHIAALMKSSVKNFDAYNELLDIKASIYTMDCIAMQIEFSALEVLHSIQIPWLESGLGV